MSAEKGVLANVVVKETVVAILHKKGDSHKVSSRAGATFVFVGVAPIALWLRAFAVRVSFPGRCVRYRMFGRSCALVVNLVVELLLPLVACRSVRPARTRRLVGVVRVRIQLRTSRLLARSGRPMLGCRTLTRLVSFSMYRFRCGRRVDGSFWRWRRIILVVTSEQRFRDSRRDRQTPTRWTPSIFVWSRWWSIVSCWITRSGRVWCRRKRVVRRRIGGMGTKRRLARLRVTRPRWVTLTWLPRCRIGRIVTRWAFTRFRRFSIFSRWGRSVIWSRCVLLFVGSMIRRRTTFRYRARTTRPRRSVVWQAKTPPWYPTPSVPRDRT